jgi:predicted DNA-binding ribbon-helix-helix protein
MKSSNVTKSQIIKRSIVIAGHKTSVSLEDAFWTGLKEIATCRDMALSELVRIIDTDRQYGNLSSAIGNWRTLQPTDLAPVPRQSPNYDCSRLRKQASVQHLFCRLEEGKRPLLLRLRHAAVR